MQDGQNRIRRRTQEAFIILRWLDDKLDQNVLVELDKAVIGDRQS